MWRPIPPRSTDVDAPLSGSEARPPALSGPFQAMSFLTARLRFTAVLFGVFLSFHAAVASALPLTLFGGGDGLLVLPNETSAAAAPVFAWLRSKGGFISPKLVYGNLVQGGVGRKSIKGTTASTSYAGMFALAPIPKGEELVRVPAAALLKGASMCDVAQRLAQERRKGQSSAFSPFVTYVFESFPHGALPANWSDEARDIFAMIVGDELEPQDIGRQGTFSRQCNGTRKISRDRILDAAYRIVLARGWTEVLAPVMDMFNHRNGKWYNADQSSSAHSGNDVSVVALRNIHAGEQIYISYSECPDTDCKSDDDEEGSIKYDYTMPQMFQDFGFVEQYPRRFNLGVRYNAPTFEIDEDGRGGLTLSWPDGQPSMNDVSWFRDEHRRLQKLQHRVPGMLLALNAHERVAINLYFSAVFEGLNEVSKAASERARPYGLDSRENLTQRSSLVVPFFLLCGAVCYIFIARKNRRSCI